MRSVTYAVFRRAQVAALDARCLDTSDEIRYRVALWEGPVDNILTDVYNEVYPPNLAA